MKNVQLMANLPEAANATAINFLTYGKKHRGHGRWDWIWDWQDRDRGQDVMLVTGRFGLKSYDLADPAHPKLLDEITAEELRLPGDPPYFTRPRTRRRRSGRTRTWTSTKRKLVLPRVTRAPTVARPPASRASRTRTARRTSPASTSSTPRTRPT